VFVKPFSTRQTPAGSGGLYREGHRKTGTGFQEGPRRQAGQKNRDALPALIRSKPKHSRPGRPHLKLSAVCSGGKAIPRGGKKNEGPFGRRPLQRVGETPPF
jgi:hypothetical protein